MLCYLYSEIIYSLKVALYSLREKWIIFGKACNMRKQPMGNVFQSTVFQYSLPAGRQGLRWDEIEFL